MTRKRSASAAAPAGPCCFVIFGASGDLTHRLLLPALYNLAAGGLLPEAFSIIGIARGEKSNDVFRSDLAKILQRFATRDIDEETVDRLLADASYVNGDADDPATYERLAQELARIERARDTRGNRLFYLATPPAAFAPIGRHLGRSGLAREHNGMWRRLIVEKPFGTDLASALDLLCSAQHRANDSIMRPAPTKVAVECRTNVGFSWFGIAVEQRLRDHDHAGDAIAALSGLLIDEGLLKSVRLVVFHQPGQSRDRSAYGSLSGGLTGPDRFSIDEDCACTALRQAAAELCPVLIEVIIENKKKWSIGWGIDGDLGPIESEFQHHDLLFALARRRYRGNISPGLQSRQTNIIDTCLHYLC